MTRGSDTLVLHLAISGVVWRIPLEERMQDFRRLKVWVKAHALELAARRITKTFPREERYELTSQIRRAAGSIAANIVEGTGRGSDRECARFLRISLASGAELQHHLVLARDLELISSADYARLESDTVEIKRMLSGFIAALTQRE
jgi:four helix bundle protein